MLYSLKVNSWFLSEISLAFQPISDLTKTYSWLFNCCFIGSRTDNLTIARPTMWILKVTFTVVTFLLNPLMQRSLTTSDSSINYRKNSLFLHDCVIICPSCIISIKSSACSTYFARFTVMTIFFVFFLLPFAHHEYLCDCMESSIIEWLIACRCEHQIHVFACSLL